MTCTLTPFLHQDLRRHTPIACNADVRIAKIRMFCKLDETGGGNLIRAATWCCA